VPRATGNVDLASALSDTPKLRSIGVDNSPKESRGGIAASAVPRVPFTCDYSAIRAMGGFYARTRREKSEDCGARCSRERSLHERSLHRTGKLRIRNNRITRAMKIPASGKPISESISRKARRKRGGTKSPRGESRCWTIDRG